MADRDVPDDQVVHASVVMNEAIAHAGHFLPLDIRELRARILGDLFSGLADDLHASHEGAFEDFVAEERHLGWSAALRAPESRLRARCRATTQAWTEA